MSTPTAELELLAGALINGVVSYNVCAVEELDPALKGGQGLVIKVYVMAGGKISCYYALKQPVDLSRLRGQAREAQVYFNLDPDEHVHLAFLVDVVRHEGVPLLVMEWAEKGSLEQWLAKQQARHVFCKGKPAMESRLMQQALELAIQLARGLNSLHTLRDSEGKPQPMVHQDLKPGNALFFGAVLKLIDFGLCCSAGDEGGEGGGLGRVDTAVGGTLKWMAPEQLRQWAETRRRRRQKQGSGKKRKPETSWDLWAFGLMLASMLNDEMAAAVQEYQRRAVGAVDTGDEEAMEQAAARMPSIAAEVIVGKAAALASSAEDAGMVAVWEQAAELLQRCFDADAAARVSAMEGEEQLQQAYAVLTGKRYPSSEQLPVQQRSSTLDVFRLFKPREREARFHRLVLGDAA
jgi:serine/threonine protein kinase